MRDIMLIVIADNYRQGDRSLILPRLLLVVAICC